MLTDPRRAEVVVVGFGFVVNRVGSVNNVVVIARIGAGHSSRGITR